MKIIYGRAGTGKSEYVFNHIKNSTDNTKKYIITPEQFSFTAEKRLLETLPEKATTNVEVLSFERMAYKVIKETIPSQLKNIGKSGKSMIVFSALEKHKNELKFLGNSLENVDLIITQITEFKKHNITIEKLEEQKNNIKDLYLKAKLNDMLIMYKELEKRIDTSFIDENDLLNILSENIEKSKLFNNAIIYLDEFAGFTKQEYQVIEKINKIAKELYITICTDDLPVLKKPEADVFYDNKQSIQSLCNLIDIDKNKQIKLEKNFRFKNKELEHLEKNIFETPYKVYNEEVKNIKLYLAENRYSEIDYVAGEIIKLVRDNNYRYQDIAVITNNIEVYASLCKVIFREYGIPVFIDEKKDITQNIVIKYVLSIIEILAKNWSYESVFNYLKTGLVPINNLFELENYCLKWGIQGKKWYEEKWNYEDYNFDEEREIIVKPLLELKEALKGKKTVRQISKKIFEFLKQNLLENDNVKYYIQEENIEAINLVFDELNEIVELFGEEYISFEEYLKLLTVGISCKELGQIPQTIDKVTMGDVNRSKTHKVKVVFIIGVNDGEYPSKLKSEGFLNDKDRDKLKNEGFELAKGTKEKLYEENYNIYKAFSTAEEKLYISYASSNSDGDALRKSLLISKLQRIFTQLKEESMKEDEIVTKEVTFAKLLNNLNNENWIEVYSWFKNNDSSKLEKAIKGIKYNNLPEKLNIDNVRKLYGTQLRTSVSKLEKYQTCPFSYYLMYGLKLSEKEKFEIKPIDTGTFMHNVLDEFFKEAMDKNIDIKSIDDEDIEKIVNEIVNDRLLMNKKFTLSQKYLNLVQRLKRTIIVSLKYIIESLKESDFEVLGTEVSFGKPNSNNKEVYPPIEIQLDNGNKAVIEGKIDRIDIAKLPNGKYVRIIDYKSSQVDIDLNKVVAGLQLQLLTYVDVVCENEDVLPAGALYFTLMDSVNAKKKMSKEEMVNWLRQNFMMKGLILADIQVIKAMDNKLEEGKSTKIPVSINSTGDIDYKKSKTLKREEFEKIQLYSKKIIKQIAREILNGDINIRPYYNTNGKKTACKWCNFKSICQFNTKFKNNNYNFIQNKNRDENLEIIKNDFLENTKK